MVIEAIRSRIVGTREDNAPEYICKPGGTSPKDPPPGYLNSEAEDGCKDIRGSGLIPESSAKSVPPFSLGRLRA